MENKFSFRVCVASGRLSILQQTVPHAGVWGQQTLESVGYCWKKRGHQVCRELRAWEELRGGVEGEYVQNTLHEIVKELIKAI